MVALAALAKVPINVVDRLMGGDRPDPVLILCKAAGLGWPTVKSIIIAPSGRQGRTSSQGLRCRLSPITTGSRHRPRSASCVLAGRGEDCRASWRVIVSKTGTILMPPKDQKARGAFLARGLGVVTRRREAGPGVCANRRRIVRSTRIQPIATSAAASRRHNRQCRSRSGTRRRGRRMRASCATISSCTKRRFQCRRFGHGSGWIRSMRLNDASGSQSIRSAASSKCRRILRRLSLLDRGERLGHAVDERLDAEKAGLAAARAACAIIDSPPPKPISSATSVTGTGNSVRRSAGAGRERSIASCGNRVSTAAPGAGAACGPCAVRRTRGVLLRFAFH